MNPSKHEKSIKEDFPNGKERKRSKESRFWKSSCLEQQGYFPGYRSDGARLSDPLLYRYFASGTGKLILIGCIFSALGYGINFIAGSNTALLGVAAILFGMGGIPINMLINLMIIECADFNEWRGNQRMEGTLSSVTSFAIKIGSALGAGVLGILLSASGYIGDVDLIPDSALNMIRNLYSTILDVLWVIVALALLLYKLDKLMPQIREDIAARRGEAKGATVEE